MSAHTPEPWHLEERGTIECGQKLNSGFIVADIGGCGPDFPANGKRIIQCVNALANIPDPAEALRMAREALDQSKTLIQMFGSFLDHWSLKREQKSVDVYAAWDEVRERSGMSEAKATAALVALKGEQK